MATLLPKNIRDFLKGAERHKQVQLFNNPYPAPNRLEMLTEQTMFSSLLNCTSFGDSSSRTGLIVGVTPIDDPAKLHGRLSLTRGMLLPYVS